MDIGSLAWLAVFPALGFLIIVHELGHYWVGRKMGVKIEEFGIGFPPRAKVLFVRKGVPFTLNWLPLGGFVRFAGEESGFDDPESLLSAPPLRRIAILAAGVIANILVAMLLFGLIFAVWGRPIPSVVAVGSVDDYAAARGFQTSDEIVSINGIEISESAQIIELVQRSEGAEQTIVVRRDGVEQTIVAAPRYIEANEAYQYGIGLDTGVERVNILTALWEGITYSVSILINMFIGFGELIGGFLGLTPAPEGGVAGPVGIARITGEAARTGPRQLLSLTAILSLNLAMINLLPIPALDGSRIIFALLEAIRRKKIPPEREAFVHALGMMFLLGLMLLVTVSDVGNIISGEPPISIPPTASPVLPTLEVNQ